MTDATEERSARWVAELDAIEAMSPAELAAEVEKLAPREDFLGTIAKISLINALIVARIPINDGAA